MEEQEGGSGTCGTFGDTICGTFGGTVCGTFGGRICGTFGGRICGTFGGRVCGTFRGTAHAEQMGKNLISSRGKAGIDGKKSIEGQSERVFRVARKD